MTSQYVDAKQVRRGCTLNVKIAFKDSSVIDENWRCYLQTSEKATGNLTAINREITTKNQEGTAFITMITSAETSNLKEGSLYVNAGEIVNSVTGEVIENHEEFLVAKSWVNRD